MHLHLHPRTAHHTTDEVHGLGVSEGESGWERERERERERQRERDRERQREKDGCVVLRVWCVGERAQSRDVDRVCVRVCKRERKEVRDKLDTFEPNVSYT